MGGVVVLLVVIVLVLGACILHPHCTTGLCRGTGTSWCL